MNDSVRSRMLVASDGSEHSLQTVRYVSSVLDRDKFEVVVFHVVTRVPESFIDFQTKIPAYRYRLVSIDAWEEQQQKSVREFMGKAEAIMLEAGFQNEAIALRIEDRNIGIARDIADESRNGYKALAVGRRGLSDLKDFMLGSISQHILGIVPIPMWIVGESSPPAKILACLDGSEESMLCLTHLADVLDASKNIDITLFYAVPSFRSFRNLMRKVFSSETDKSAVERIDAELDEAAALMEPSFDKARAVLVSNGIDPAHIDHKVVRGAGNAAQAIMEEAENGNYDTILVGKRGLSKVEEFAIGRVSNRVVNMAKDKTVWVVS